MNQVFAPISQVDFAASEVPVRLEQLDGRLKAIVRLKLREFITLTPVFQHIPSIGTSSDASRMFAAPFRIDGEIFYELESVALRPVEPVITLECPNRPSRIAVRRRPNRAVTV